MRSSTEQAAQLMVHPAPEMVEFGRLLAAALTARGMTQLELANELGVSQGTVSTWKLGTAVPFVKMVFEVERVLRLRPGHLSRALGFLPMRADDIGPASDVELSVLEDPVLDEDDQRMLLNLYREMVERQRRVRRSAVKPKG